MKKLLLIAILAITSQLVAQNPGYILLKKINGVEIYYKTVKTKEDTKKDTWSIDFEYINTTGKDIFYKSVLSEATIFENAGYISYFGVVTIKNAKMLSLSTSDPTDVSGDKLRLLTDKGEPIYIIKKGKTYTRNMDFRAEKGVEPILSIEVINSISFTESITEFM